MVGNMRRQWQFGLEEDNGVLWIKKKCLEIMIEYPLDYICEVILPHVIYTINFTKQI